MDEHPTVGVEEEFLLVDDDTGEPVAANHTVAREAGARTSRARLAREGNGAMRQVRAWQRRGDAADVITEAAAATLR